MKRTLSVLLIFAIAFSVAGGLLAIPAFAENKSVTLTGTAYDLGEDDKYEIAKAQATTDSASRFYVKGDIGAVSTKNGFTSYGVNSGNLDIMVDKDFGAELFEQPESTEWHIITDKGKKVDSTSLTQSIGSGAIIVQTSRDGKTWINCDTVTDFYSNMDTMNHSSSAGDSINAFYRTTNVQLTNGCYYRIIVAYKLQREVDPSNVWFVEIKQTEEKERIEIYQFYAYDTTVNQAETLSTKNAYEFGDVYRVDSQDGFSNPTLIKGDDPHIDWSVGKFYVSGYTDVIMDNGVPVFLKVPGDRAALWFNLEQEIDKCNGRTDVKINYIESGSDIYFGTPVIKDFGRGALIVRKTDKENKKERQIYTNYLEASATVGANTRVDLFEEGDYEVALDYQLHYDKPFVFGTTTTKTLTYRIFFKFKVRNGDISVFLRDVDTNQFITNANVAEHGFYIDVAQSQYLNMTIKREVLTDSLDGLVQDTKFSGVAKEGRHYTDEGIYTVTVKNLATGDSVTKRVYVGNRDILLAHMKTGLSISEINERLAAGATIDANGSIIDPVPVVEEPVVTPTEAPASVDPTDTPVESAVPASTEIQPSTSPKPAPNQDSASPTETTMPAQEDEAQAQNKPNTAVIIAIAAVLVGSGGVAGRKLLRKKKETKK